MTGLAKMKSQCSPYLVGLSSQWPDKTNFDRTVDDIHHKGLSVSELCVFLTFLFSQMDRTHASRCYHGFFKLCFRNCHDIYYTVSASFRPENAKMYIIYEQTNFWRNFMFVYVHLIIIMLKPHI